MRRGAQQKAESSKPQPKAKAKAQCKAKAKAKSKGSAKKTSTEKATSGTASKAEKPIKKVKQPDEADAATAEKKAKYSRKSSAYHKAKAEAIKAGKSKEEVSRLAREVAMCCMYVTFAMTFRSECQCAARINLKQSEAYRDAE